MWADNLTQWCRDNDRSKAWLARKAGVTPDHLYRCMKDREKPSAELLEALERVMAGQVEP